MKKNIHVLLILIAFAFVLSSCYYHNAEDLYSDNNQNLSNCDTLTVIYSSQIKPFFDGKCISCHNSGGTYPAFDNFSDAHAYATSGGNQLYNKVSTNHKNKNPTDCEIAQIKKWVETGAN
jgi:hypothetical protein